MPVKNSTVFHRHFSLSLNILLFFLPIVWYTVYGLFFKRREEAALDSFKLHSPYSPTGDQPQAIDKLSAGVEAGQRFQTLMGVTGSGKTFTMANIIANTNRPTLVLAHNKTLAAQLCCEFREFFPENAVEYFVS